VFSGSADTNCEVTRIPKIPIRRSNLAEYHQLEAEIKRFMNRRGNPNWGRPIPLRPAVATEFEVEVKRLRLTPGTYVLSHELRRWCLQNRNRCYIPEWLLDAWNIRVNPYFEGAA
jgi:hypothetical protein